MYVALQKIIGPKDLIMVMKLKPTNKDLEMIIKISGILIEMVYRQPVHKEHGKLASQATPHPEPQPVHATHLFRPQTNHFDPDTQQS